MKYREDERTELKREWTDDIKKEIIAFANTESGTLIIGVDDSGSVVGVMNAVEVQLRLTNMLRDAIKPDITMFVSSEIGNIDGTDVLFVNVQRGTHRPYYLSAKGLTSAGVYVRQGTSSSPASDAHIRKMILETDGDQFELRRSLQQELTFDYTEAEFRKRNLEFTVKQHVTLGLVAASPRTYSNVAFLLSDQCSFTTKVAIFQGTTKEVFKDRREFGGSLLKQLNDVYEFINLNNHVRAEISGLLRIDRRDVPEVAVREALLNAMVHREYGLSSSTLISILDDRIEFVSVGGLVAGLTLEDIQLGVSVCRNEKLAAIFYRLKLIEAYGTGITKIFDSYRDALVKPTIAQSENAFRITLPNVNAIQTENLILEMARQKSLISRRDVQDMLGISQTKAGQLLRDLVERNLLNAVGAGRNTGYVIV